MNSLVVRRLVPRVSRTFSTTWRAQVENRIKEHQQRFQQPDGLPVHLKGGKMDMYTYKGILFLTAFGTLWAVGTLGKMCFKKD